MAEPVVLNEQRREDVAAMSLLDVALKEIGDDLERGCPYNVEYYYGYYGQDDERIIEIRFIPVDLRNTEEHVMTLRIDTENQEVMPVK